MICVYPADCKDFSNNGLGIVLPQSCSVTETLNGEWELTLIHPIDVDGKWTRLTEGCILRAPVPAAMTPQVGLVTQQYQTTVYDILIYKVSTQRDPLRLRSGPGTDYRILGKYAKETEIIVLDKSNSGWYEVTCPDGKHGYMSSEYLTYVRTDTGSTQSNVGFHNQTIQARQLRDQPFRIYRVVPELDKVTVYARHVFYDLLDNMIKSLRPSPDAVGASVVQSLSASCLTGHGFTFYSDLTSSAEDVAWENKNPVEAMLGEGGLVEKYAAELARDWFDVFLVQRVGHDSDVQIRERKNLTGISYREGLQRQLCAFDAVYEYAVARYVRQPESAQTVYGQRMGHSWCAGSQIQRHLHWAQQSGDHDGELPASAARPVQQRKRAHGDERQRQCRLQGAVC